MILDPVKLAISTDHGGRTEQTPSVMDAEGLEKGGGPEEQELAWEAKRTFL